MNGYTKLFSSIVSSTIWQEDLATKVVWITMLAMSDSDGTVEGSVPGLAHIAGVSLEECERALSKLQQPDKYSRTPDNDGRRIEVVDGGWFILNRAKYRDKDWVEDKAERRREVNRRYYEKIKTNSDLKSLTESESDFVRDKKEKEKEKEKEESKALRFAPPSLEEVARYCQERKNQIDPEKFHAYYEANGWYAGRVKMKNWRAAVHKWERDNFGGPFRDGYQKSAQQLRNERNAAALERVFGEDASTEDMFGPPGERQGTNRR